MKIPTFHPEDKLIKFWKVLIVLVIIYNAFVVPFRIAFKNRFDGIWVWFDLIGDLLLVADIFWRFHIGYFTDGEYIQDKKKIAQRYQTRNFKIHLLASFPADLIARILMPNSLPFIIGILRLPRLLRLAQCYRIFSNWETNISINPSLMRMCKLVILIFLINHWVACIWFLIGSWEASVSQDSWLINKSLESVGISTQYVNSLYWAITTLTTVGYGDITPTTEIEIIFTLIVMFMGVSMYAYIIGSVSSLISNLDAAKARYREKLDQIQTYMRENKISPNLQQKIRDYYQYTWLENRDIRDYHILEELPYPLRTKVALQLHKEVIEKVPIFQGATAHFVEEIVMALKPQILPPNEYIIREGNLGHEMYFIKRGVVQAFSEKTGIIYRNMGAGSFFGEIALVYQKRRTASIITLTYCELFVLDKDDFKKVLENYPEFAEHVKQTAESRYQEAKKE